MNVKNLNGLQDSFKDFEPQEKRKNNNLIANSIINSVLA